MNLKRIFGSLTFRFMFAYVAGLSLAVFVVLALIFASYSYNYYSSVKKSVETESERLLAIYNKSGQEALKAALNEPQQARYLDRFIYLLTDADHVRLAGELDAWPAENYGSWLELEYTARIRGVDEGEHRITHTVALDNNHQLVVARNYREVLVFEHVILNVLLRSMLATILLGAIGGAVVAGSTVRDADTLNAAVQSIMRGDLSGRISADDSGTNFRNLAILFNGMLDRIEALMESMRQVTDNIAHDLRTPLTRLRNHLVNLQAQVSGDTQHTVQALLEEADGLLATFNALLRIAQIESGNRVSGFQPLDLTIILRDTIELYEPLAAEKQIEIAVDLADELPVTGDRDLLFQAFANVLDNAIKYTPEGGCIDVYARIDNTDIRVEVADSGWGIPLADRDKVFRRFYRVESSRSQQPGNGLGLSLVQAVVNLHSGSISLADNNPGLKVIVQLPVLRETV